MAEGDRAAARFSVQATQRVEFSGVPASSRLARWSGMAMWQVVGGRVQAP